MQYCSRGQNIPFGVPSNQACPRSVFLRVKSSIEINAHKRINRRYPLWNRAFLGNPHCATNFSAHFIQAILENPSKPILDI
ncbi:Putative membrane ycf1 [Gossypium arboreum]|uniref:Putative membrane ycf1 n=1 Tax=Gossypium arboreum TaxID=29729 RepID=A0A0B0PDX5_GOSAR|nr:Putative membrane ycf1 [Gossypium arboreum]